MINDPFSSCLMRVISGTSVLLFCCNPVSGQAPINGLHEVSHKHVKLEGGFWGPRLELHCSTTLPYVLHKLDSRNHFANFDVAARVLNGELQLKQEKTNNHPSPLEGNAGQRKKPDDQTKKEKDENPSPGIVGNHAYDSDAFKALEGACYCQAHEDCKVELSHVDSIIDRMLAAQDKDGYLNSYYIAKEPENKWKNLRLNHEMYNAGHFIELAVARYQLDGESKALDAAKRLADHIDSIFGPNKRYDVGGHQGIEIALLKLFRVTGENRYLNLCRFLLEERGQLHGMERKPFDKVIPKAVPPRRPDQTMREWRRMKWSMRNGRMQDHKPVLEQKGAVGHAVRAGYMYSAMTDMARLSDAPEYANAVKILWEDVVYRKMYLTGGIGTAQYGDEGFGDPYHLPNKTYCESCSSIAHVFWQHRMCLMEEDAKYADVMELTLYNSALSGLGKEGKSFFYQNPLESRNGAQRSEWIGLACCPTNITRFIPQIGGFVYATKANRINVNLYAQGQAHITLSNGDGFKLSQVTDYPYDGKITLKVDPDKPSQMDLRLRIPGWTKGRPVPGNLYHTKTPHDHAVTVKLNGNPVNTTSGDDGYLVINRSWKKGDVVELDFPMPVMRVFAHEKVLENKNRVALMKGPVTYAFEGVDQPDGTDLFQIALPDEATLSSQQAQELFGGIPVIKSTAMDTKGQPIAIKAIPYHLWANRGKTPMVIWLQRQAKN